MPDSKRTESQWEKTIVAFQPPYKLKDLCMPASDQTVHGISYKIRVASTNDRRRVVNELIGQKFGQETSAAATNLEVDPNRVILELHDDANVLVGTITLCFDGAQGLDVDETYKDEVDQLRADGSKLVELTNFAATGAFANKSVMGPVVHLAFIYAKIHQYTDFIVEVKARHSKYYEKMLGFEAYGPVKACSWTDEYVVLLRLNLSRVAERIEKLGGSYPRTAEAKSLYPYFFTKSDEIGIAARLTQGS